MDILTNNKNLSYTKDKNTFTISGKYVPFKTEYSIMNPKTGVSEKFNLSHSTGSEWDPKTVWIYKNQKGMILNVLNDEVTEANAKTYLNHKLSK